MQAPSMPFSKAMRKGYEFVLRELGFTHKQYPDGWFWCIQPDLGSEAAKTVSVALGYEGDYTENLPDGFTIIFQCSNDFVSWTYVCGGFVNFVKSLTLQFSS